MDGFASFSGAYVLLGGSGGILDSGLLFVTYVYQVAFPGGGGTVRLSSGSRHESDGGSSSCSVAFPHPASSQISFLGMIRSLVGWWFWLEWFFVFIPFYGCFCLRLRPTVRSTNPLCFSLSLMTGEPLLLYFGEYLSFFDLSGTPWSCLVRTGFSRPPWCP